MLSHVKVMLIKFIQAVHSLHGACVETAKYKPMLIGAVRISSNWYITNSNNTTSLNTSYVMYALPV
jgi:hypothetical protein